MNNIQKLALNIRDGADLYNLPGIRPEDVDSPGSNTSSLNSLIVKFLSVAIMIGALLLLMYLIWGGIEWITSGGDKSKTEKARDKITGAIVGILVLAAAVAIFTLVQRFLGINVLNFCTTNEAGVCV